MDVFEAIAGRRSIKPAKLKPDPLSRADLERVLEAANWAPSHGLTEPWRFVVFRGEARLRWVEAVLDTMREDGETGPIPADDPRREQVAKMLVPPVVVAIICEPSPNPKIVELEEVISTGIAVHNLSLAARALGIASFWTSGKKAVHPAMSAFLGLKAPARCLGFLYLGYPAGEWPEGARKPIADKVRWVET